MQAGFDAFVTARGAVLWRAAWLLLSDRQLAEDLVQTALSKCYPRYASIGDDEQFEAYVRRTIFTTYVSWWRRKWKAEIPSDTLPHAVNENLDPGSGVDVARALAGLSKMQRAVVVLRYYEDRSVAETAELLGISPGAVKTHASRGCAALRASAELANYAGAS